MRENEATGGGGAGATVIYVGAGLSPSTSYYVTVGTGGKCTGRCRIASTPGIDTLTDGAASSFSIGSLSLIANGGNSGDGAGGGIGIGGAINISGGPGCSAYYFAIYGGGGYRGPGLGGSSSYGVVSYGAGGSGAAGCGGPYPATGYCGANGQDGIVRLEWIE